MQSMSAVLFIIVVLSKKAKKIVCELEVLIFKGVVNNYGGAGGGVRCSVMVTNFIVPLKQVDNFCTPLLNT